MNRRFAIATAVAAAALTALVITASIAALLDRAEPRTDASLAQVPSLGIATTGSASPAQAPALDQGGTGASVRTSSDDRVGWSDDEDEQEEDEEDERRGRRPDGDHDEEDEDERDEDD